LRRFEALVGAGLPYIVAESSAGDDSLPPPKHESSLSER